MSPSPPQLTCGQMEGLEQGEESRAGSTLSTNAEKTKRSQIIP